MFISFLVHTYVLIFTLHNITSIKLVMFLNTALSTVATLLLLELHAVGRINESANLQPQDLEAAAKNYAIETFREFFPNLLP